MSLSGHHSTQGVSVTVGLDLLLGLSTGLASPPEHLGSDRPPPTVLYSLSPWCMERRYQAHSQTDGLACTFKLLGDRSQILPWTNLEAQCFLLSLSGPSEVAARRADMISEPVL